MLTRFDDYRWQITTANRLIVEDRATSVKKAYMYVGPDGSNPTAGVEFLDYEDWAEFHIQDIKVAHELAEGMLNTGTSENYDKSAGVFESYEIVNRHEFLKQALGGFGETIGESRSVPIPSATMAGQRNRSPMLAHRVEHGTEGIGF